MIGEGEFFELFKRVFKRGWVAPDGIPSLQSSDLIRPQTIAIVKSNGANWTRLFINRAVYIWTLPTRRVDYISGQHPGDLSAASPSPWNSSVTGVCKLFAPGEWHVKTPLISGDAENTPCAFIMSDAALGLDNGNVSAAEIAGPAALGNTVNVTAWGGTPQTGQDIGASFNHPTFVGQGGITVNAADTPVLAANASRKFMMLLNASTGGQYIGFWVGTATGVGGAGMFIVLPPGGGYMFDRRTTLPPLGIIRAWASAAGGLAYVSEGV